MSNWNGKIIPFGVVGAIALSLISWGATKNEVGRLKEDVKGMPVKIAVMQTDLEYLKSDFAEFKLKQEEMSKLLLEIWGKVNGQ